MASIRIVDDGKGDVNELLGRLQTAGFAAVIEPGPGEERRLEVLRLETLGRLAGGVAHDFNNLLTTISGYADLLLEQIEPASGIRAGVEEIRKSGERGASLTRHILAFSRRPVVDARLIDLNPVLGNLEKTLGRLLGSDIALSIAQAQGLAPVKADPGQIEQALLNLAVGAREAMPRGGRLAISSRSEARDGRLHAVVSLAYAGGGAAAPEAPVPSPSLGALVERNGGFLRAAIAPGGEATVELWLPAAAVDERRRATAAAPRPGETILLVEDEEALRPLFRAILAARGYRCLVAADGREALAAAAAEPGRIDLLITDVVLPGLSGPDLAREIERTCPGTRVLYMSGYADDPLANHGVAASGRAFLGKPFTPREMAEKIRSVLDAPPAASAAA